MKEAKGTSVPVAQYTAEGLPNINLDYKEVSDSEIIQNGYVSLLIVSLITILTNILNVIPWILISGQRSTNL